jgi:ketosteroid isomerase-like protein
MKTFTTLLICIGLSISFAGTASEMDKTPDFKKLVQDQYITPFKNADTDRWMQVFADNAVGMHNTLPAFVGKEAISQFAIMVADNLNIEQMDIVLDEVRVNGSWALTRGSFISKFVPKNVSDSASIPASKGKFILLWERQPDGVWKVILDMGNSSESSPAPS